MQFPLDNFKILCALLRRELYLIKANFINAVVDSMVIVSLYYLVYGKLFPLMGFNVHTITPIFFGLVVLVLINITYDRALLDSFDLDFVRFIDYQICLPVSINWILAKYVLGYIFDLFISSVFVLLIGKFMFGSMLEIENGSLLLFFLIYSLSIIMVALFLLIMVIAKPLWWIRDSAWPRVLLPVTLFGSIFYPWYSVYTFSSIIGTLYLLNPFIYMIEGMRSAATYNPVYISAYMCALILCALIGISLVILKKVTHKRLDPLV